MARSRWFPIFAGAAALSTVAMAIPASGVSSAHNVPAATPDKGISIVFGDASAPASRAVMLSKAKAMFTYAKSLHANAVSLNFPFYMDSQTSNTPHSGIGTLSPQLLGSIVALGKSQGLRVQVRPLLSELNFNTAVTKKWRGSITPSNIALWFANYKTWLHPYLVSARTNGANSFSVGAELVTMTPYQQYWVGIVNDAKRCFGSEVIYSASHNQFNTVRGTKLGWDAYQPIIVPATASVSTLTAGFIKNFTVPGFPGALRTTRLEEVGIPAVSGAYGAPYYFYYPSGVAINRTIQANWFTAACNAFWSAHMQGIYYWALSFNSFSPSRNDSADPYGWMATTSESAISTCFARNS